MTDDKGPWPHERAEDEHGDALKPAVHIVHIEPVAHCPMCDPTIIGLPRSAKDLVPSALLGRLYVVAEGLKNELSRMGVTGRSHAHVLRAEQQLKECNLYMEHYTHDNES